MNKGLLVYNHDINVTLKKINIKSITLCNIKPYFTYFPFSPKISFTSFFFLIQDPLEIDTFDYYYYCIWLLCLISLFTSGQPLPITIFVIHDIDGLEKPNGCLYHFQPSGFVHPLWPQMTMLADASLCHICSHFHKIWNYFFQWVSRMRSGVLPWGTERNLIKKFACQWKYVEYIKSQGRDTEVLEFLRAGVGGEKNSFACDWQLLSKAPSSLTHIHTSRN